jgi:HSP20 family molecular chaperone IbpA
MNTADVKRTLSKPMVVGLAMLILGLLIGVAAEKRSQKNPSPARNIQAVDTAPGSSVVGAQKQKTPDPFDQDFFDSWDPFREMRSLQAEMDEMFRRSITRFRQNPQMGIFKDDAGYSLSLDVRELKDRYEVRAFLPDAKAADANVKLQGNRLEVEVTHRPTVKGNKNEPDTVTEWGRYTQTVDLAGNLKADQMKVEHKDHELVITIPKA